MSHRELSERHQRLQRKLAASYEGWHSGRVDRLEEALRAIQAELRLRDLPPIERGDTAFDARSSQPWTH